MNYKFKHISILALLALMCFTCSLQAQNEDLRTAAFRGGSVFVNDGFSFPVINDLGHVAFLLEGISTEILFTEGPNGVAEVLREGDPVPGSNGSMTIVGLPNSITTFSNSGDTVLNLGARSGVTGVGFLLRTSSSSDQEILVDTSGAVSGLDGTDITRPSNSGVRLNANGEVAFSSGGSVFSDTGGQGFRVVAEPDQVIDAAGISELVRLEDVSSFALNDSSQHLLGSDIFGFASGLFIEDNGAFSLVASTLTDVGSGLFIDTFEHATLNNRGDSIFVARLDGNGVTFSNSSAIIGNVGGSLQILARQGDTVPGTDITIGDLTFSEPALGGGGDTTFTVGGGLFLIDENGTIEVIAQTGESLPVLSNGEFITSFIRDPAINENGQIAFQARLGGDGVSFNNDEAIFATDTDGILQLIARDGDLLDLSDDPTIPDVRQIDQLGFIGSSGDGDGLASGFNNLGEVAFQARFDRDSIRFNGDGIFVSSLVAEPKAEVLPGDVNRDGEVDFLDIAAFVSVITLGGDQAEADIDGNSVVDFEDIPLFVQLLVGDT